MRKACTICMIKHVCQARALLKEVRKGYPENWGFAMGHLAEAEDESVELFPALASNIRSYRKQLELDPDFVVPWRDLMLVLMMETGYSIRQEDNWMKKVSSWLKHLIPLLALSALTAYGGSIKQPHKSTAQIQSIAKTTVVDNALAATLAASAGRIEWGNGYATWSGTVVTVTTWTNTSAVFVSQTNGAGYNGPALGLTWTNPVWGGAVYEYPASGGLVLFASGPETDIHLSRSWVIGLDNAWYSDGSVVLPAVLLGDDPPNAGSFTLAFVTATNTTPFNLSQLLVDDSSTGISTNHSILVGDIFYITNGTIRAITPSLPQ